MGILSVRAAIFGGLISVVATALAQAQNPQCPPNGGGGGPPSSAMIFYVAHGAAGACGKGCAEWIAAEGTIQWDTYKRLIAILDRQAGRKLPIIIDAQGASDLNVATSLGRIMRDRGIDTAAGSTEVKACHGKAEAECLALKRAGDPLDANVNSADTRCDLGCVLALAGGIHRSLPYGTRVFLSGTCLRNRLASKISDEHRQGLTAQFGERLRRYIREMGLEPEIVDIVDRNSETGRQTELPPSEWLRLRIVTSAAL